LAGIVSNWPLKYAQPDAVALQQQLDEFVTGSTLAASKRMIRARLGYLSSAQLRNGFKAIAVISAMSFEVVGIALVAISAGFLVAQR
jgi:hypothetical protein